MLKYFRGLGLPRKYITINIYTRMKYYVRKMEDNTRNLCVAFMFIATFGMRLNGKCFGVKERQEMLRTGMLWR